MKGRLFVALLFVLITSSKCATQENKRPLPVMGFSIEAPTPETFDLFMNFVNQELVPSHINLLILRLNWSYAPKSHPELADGSNVLSKKDIRKLREVCEKNGIRIVPLLNLLGHQSKNNQSLGLLKAYPQFEEVPSKVDSRLRWPQPEGFYCKSYCPLHPDVHQIVFDVIDEICEDFKADVFHAGMDEVFYIGEADCPSCHGKDRSVLFANEVKAIHDHLASKGRKMMMWGDRLLDGRTTGLGMWEASYMDTWRAIDMIPKDIFICNCHYEKAESSSLFFAKKGFNVATGGYKLPDVSVQQVKDMIKFRKQEPEETANHICGYIHTVWNSAGFFINRYYDDNQIEAEGQKQPNIGVEATKTVFGLFRELSDNN